MRVCPTWPNDLGANLTLLRDRALRDKLEWTLVEAWVDGELPRAYGSSDASCERGEPVARFVVAEGKHELVVASEFRGRGLWQGPTWKSCIAIPFEAARGQMVEVRVAPAERAASVPEERIAFKAVVSPSTAGLPPSRAAIKRGLPLCRAFYGPSR
jgi:hypothetical protein